MEIILIERVENLGKVGDKVNVKAGYARNYLLPYKKALRATKENIAYYEKQKAVIEANNEKLLASAKDLSKKIANLEVFIIRQAAETGQLYGSVTGRDVRDAINEKGFDVERKQVELNIAIKNVGSYNVVVKLHPDVTQTVKVNVGRSMDEAKKVATDDKKAKAAFDDAVAEVAAPEVEAPEKPVKAKKAKAKKEEAAEASEEKAEKPAKAKKAKAKKDEE